MDSVDIGLWVAQGLLGLAMAASGGMKAMTPREKLMPRMPWVARFPAWAPRAIGVAEVAGAAGLVLPWATGVFPILTPIAGACLATLMGGAVKVHLDDGDAKGGIPAGILGVLGLVVAVGRATWQA